MTSLATFLETVLESLDLGFQVFLTLAGRFQLLLDDLPVVVVRVGAFELRRQRGDVAVPDAVLEGLGQAAFEHLGEAAQLLLDQFRLLDQDGENAVFLAGLISSMAAMIALSRRPLRSGTRRWDLFARDREYASRFPVRGGPEARLSLVLPCKFLSTPANFVNNCRAHEDSKDMRNAPGALLRREKRPRSDSEMSPSVSLTSGRAQDSGFQSCFKV